MKCSIEDMKTQVINKIGTVNSLLHSIVWTEISQ